MADFDLNLLPDQSNSFDLNEIPNSNILGDQEDDDTMMGNNVGSAVPPNHQDAEANDSISIISSSNVVPELDIHMDFNEEENLPGNVHMFQVDIQQTKYKNLTNEQRRLIYDALLIRSIDGKLKRATIKEVASLFSVPYKSVQRIWKRAKDAPNDMIVDVSSKKPGKIGRKRVTIDLDSIVDIPLSRRTTLRSLGQAMNVNHATLYNRLQEGLLRSHSNAIKPLLKEENKIARLKFCISMLDTDSLPLEPRFLGMYNIVHIDEKWFYMTKKSTSYYLLPREYDPVRSCQSKNFIGKVMFLTAVARPRFDEEGNEVFSGKIGVFPFVTMEPAIRRSRNREAGTLETKPITSVKKETVRAFLLEKVIPAIRAKWPADKIGETIFIQQDNVRIHVRPEDKEFQAAASQNGFNIRLLCQPSNSPDMNVLDLGFLAAIQSLKDKECLRTIDELIGAVQNAFENYSTEKMNHIFLTLQLCMRETMIKKGSNDYKIPHIGKVRLESSGILPKQISCDRVLVESTMNILATTQ